jgi:hypothetical protein
MIFVWSPTLRNNRLFWDGDCWVSIWLTICSQFIVMSVVIGAGIFNNGGSSMRIAGPGGALLAFAIMSEWHSSPEIPSFIHNPDSLMPRYHRDLRV